MSDRVAATAVGPMMVVAVENQRPSAEKIISDDLAITMLPSGWQWVARQARHGWVRRLLLLAMNREAPGMWDSIACRKRFADDQVKAALDAGIDTLVLLGAGFDTKGHRLARPHTRVFEVDKPSNISAKAQRITAPDHITSVPIDFQTDDLAKVLAEHGFPADEPAVFVWEGVTQYLSESGVRATLQALSHAAPGSRLIFTYVRADFLDGSNLYGAPRLHRRFVQRHRIWWFGSTPEAIGDLLSEYGWHLTTQYSAPEFHTHYLKPAGRPTPPSNLEYSAHAERVVV